jgi:hypothetical protein
MMGDKGGQTKETLKINLSQFMTMKLTDQLEKILFCHVKN